MVDVDWQLLGKAMFHYGCAGFTPVTLPWAVPRNIAAVTCADDGRMYPFEDGVLVGSAEQAFMELQFRGDLAPGRYVACTPCFRKEPELDDLHQKYFMKVELYSTEERQDGKALELAKAAQNFMKAWAQVTPDIVKTDEGYDLQVAGIEIGSYMTRNHDGHVWTCGTGLAEPRLTIARDIAASKSKKKTR